MGADRDSHFLDLAEKAVAEELADTSKTKAEIWTAMGDYLEVHGVPANLVRQSVQDAIEKRLREKLGYKVSIYTSHFHNTMKAGGWPPEEDEPEINPEPKAIFTSVNQDFCDALDTVAAHAKFMRDVASTLQRPDGTFLRMTDVIPRKVYDTFVVQTTEMARVAKDYANQKSKVPPTLHQIFRETLKMSTGLLQAGKVFQQVRMEMLCNVTKWITTKQAGKIEDMMEQNMLPLYQPRSRDVAIFMGWYGLSCPACKSWLVREARDEEIGKLYCYNCTGEFDGYTVSHCPRCRRLIYAEDVPELLKTQKCPDCEIHIRLPKEMEILAE